MTDTSEIMPFMAGGNTRPSATTVEWYDDLASLRTEWRRLAEQSGNVFMTWEWADAWRRHLAGRVRLAILLARRAGGDPQAIIPLYDAGRGPIHVMRFIGAGPSDELGPVCAPADRADSARVMQHHAPRLLAPGGVLLAERLDGRASIAGELGGAIVQRSATPVIELAGRSFEDYLAAQSANFRSQARRTERRLSRERQLEFRLTTEPDELERDLGELIRLHRRRWADGRSDAFSGQRAAFHLDFARRALENGWLRLWTAELDGRPAAAWYGLRFGGADHYYQSGRDPAHASLKVGFALLCHTIRCACEDGVREYRLGLGDEAYKRRFCTADPGLETVAVAVGVRGRIGVSALRAGLRVRELARGNRRMIGGLSKAGAASSNR